MDPLIQTYFVDLSLHYCLVSIVSSRRYYVCVKGVDDQRVVDVRCRQCGAATRAGEMECSGDVWMTRRASYPSMRSGHSVADVNTKTVVKLSN